MTPIIDGLRRLTEDPEDTQTDDETIDKNNHHYSDTTSTDTFQTNDSNVEKSRKTSRTETNDLSSLRNLSTNGLMMFDPLVINAVSASTSAETNRQLPDNDLVTSLNEQVTEIADRLSSIATDIDIQEHNQTHSLSTNDVPTLINETDFGFSGPRNEPLSCMPSTSHGYLIPNAISQEPVVLASLSHNNSAVFNQEDEEVTGAILNSDLPLIMPDNIEAEIVNTNICIANANLSSLLLTNDEFRQNFVDNDIDGDNASFHSAKMTLDRDERVKFMLGYDSEHESPVDSGVSTENTSLDRSPDTDQSKDNFMQQNRVIKDLEEERREDRIENYLERSFSTDDTIKQAGPSNNVEIDRISTEEDGLNEATNIKDLDWTNTEQSSKDSIKELRRSSEVKSVEENRSSTELATHSGRQRKSRKSSKKKKKMWPPGIVILDNRNTQVQNPLRLNLDHIMDER